MALAFKALLAGFLCVSCFTAALAQDFTAEQRAACKADYNKVCKGTMPGGGRVFVCLNRHYGSLSEACKKVVDAQKK